MLIPEHKIQEVIERVDLVTLISRHVELKKAGRSYKGRCPFHQEKSASFHVTPEMRRYKCFGCQAGGDAISFVQRYFGKTFVDAVKDLATEAGVDLASSIDPSMKERQALKDATDFAAEFFKSRLWNTPAGKTGLSYLASRGISEATIKDFGLGWAPAAWSDLAEAFTARGFLDFGVKAGLIAPRPRGEGYYDVFRGRLMVPIRSPEGRTIAFGGRLVEGTSGPKYLNSRESKLYNKSETLFGVDKAKDAIRKKKTAVLVEGYFDCIGLHQVGVQHAVALCSTALTPGHLQLLARTEARELVLLLDGDEAGRKAVERLAGPLLSSQASAKVALLPDGDDPDTFARKSGAHAVNQLLESAPPLSQHLLQSVLPKGRQSSFEEKMQALTRLKPIFSQLPLGLTRTAFMGATANFFGVPQPELEQELGNKGAVKSGPVTPSHQAPSKEPKPERPPEPLELLFAALLLKHPALLASDTSRAADEVSHLGLRAIVAHVGQSHSPEDALYEAPPSLQKALEASLRQLPNEIKDLESFFKATQKKLKVRRIDEQLAHIAKVTAGLQSAHDLTDDTRRLLTERGELLALKRRLLQE